MRNSIEKVHALQKQGWHPIEHDVPIPWHANPQHVCLHPTGAFMQLAAHGQRIKLDEGKGTYHFDVTSLAQSVQVLNLLQNATHMRTQFGRKL